MILVGRIERIVGRVAIRRIDWVAGIKTAGRVEGIIRRENLRGIQRIEPGNYPVIELLRFPLGIRLRLSQVENISGLVIFYGQGRVHVKNPDQGG
jgi:hypothetical protein